MKKYLMGIFAVVLAIGFTTLSSFTKKQGKALELTVRYLQDETWSSSNEQLPDAETSSGCPNGAVTICAEFYQVSHLNIVNGVVTGIKFMPGTTTRYSPDKTLYYN